MKVIDMHCDTIYEIDRILGEGKDVNLKKNQLNIDLEKMEKSHYILQNFAIFTPLKKVNDPIEHVQHLIDTFYLEIENNKDMIGVVYKYNDIINNQNNHRMSALLTLEEGAVVHNDLAYLRNYYRLGVRMITLNWNYENGIGFPNFNMNHELHGYHTCDTKNGLTEFGIQYIQECERMGIIIDVSHLSDAGFYDVLKYTTKPFVASHSNARSVCPHARNMSDEMIKELVKRGGVLGINFAADFLDENHEEGALSKVSSMVKHILYIKSIGGIDCIGLGSDFDGIPQNLEIKDASYMSLLYNALLDAGLSEEDVNKVFYENVLNLYKKVLI